LKRISPNFSLTAETAEVAEKKLKYNLSVLRALCGKNYWLFTGSKKEASNSYAVVAVGNRLDVLSFQVGQ
jgi:hypothetical protein